MNKKTVTLVIASVTENGITTVATNSIADIKYIKTLTMRIERLEQLKFELVQRLDRQSNFYRKRMLDE